MGNGMAGGRQMNLDAHQTAVVELDALSSAVVVGAPGSGKTTTLVARVAALTSGRGDDALDPDSVLVLTPSRQTATALRDELALAVGRATSGPLARSLTSFAFRLVRAACVASGDAPPQLLTGGDEDQIIADLLDGDAEDETDESSRWPDWLSTPIRSTPGFRAEVRAFFAECTTLGIDPQRLRALGEASDRPVWVSLGSFFGEYLQVRSDMRGAHRDAAGLVREAVHVLRTAGPGIEAIDRLQVIVIDDAQELTLGGVELIAAARERGIAVVAFGDPDVGSGTFRGATPANFAQLTGLLGQLFVLSDVHRGGKWNNDVVRRITQRIGAVGVVAHRTPTVGAAPDSTVRALLLRSSAEEYDAIARLLRERHVHDGIEWGQCAVIAHDSRQVAALEAELTARDVPARASGPGRALGVLRPVRDLLRLIEFAGRDSWTYDDATELLLSAYGRLDPIDLRRLRAALRHAALAESSEQSGRELLLSAMRNPIEFDLIDMREARRAAVLARTLEVLRQDLNKGATAHELMWTAWERSGLERPWAEAARGNGPLAEQAHRDLDAVVAAFQAAKRFVERSLDADPRVFVRGLLDSDVAEDRLDAPPRDDAVRVLTPAGALGMEFDTVFVAGVQEGVWPNTRLRGSVLETWRLSAALATGAGEADPVDTLDRRREAMHDELRLLARAMSRASSRVVVTAVDDDDAGPSVFFEFLPDAEHFAVDHPLSLRGVVAQHRRAVVDALSAKRAEHAAGQLALLADARVAGAAPEQWFGVAPVSSMGPLRDLDREDIRVSPSRLHTLEECELNWVIGDLGGDPGGATAGLGTIIHAALEHAQGIDEASLWAEVAARWGELDFEAAWRDRAEQTRAKDLVRRLHLYLRRFDASGGTLLTAEPHFEVSIALEDAGSFEHGVILSGYIDRVELTPEGTVVIIDLKTGKREPQTDAKVIDNPQLAAYQLAFDDGAIAGVDKLPPGGAKLLVLRPSAKKADFVEPWQPPFDDERREQFLSRVRNAAWVMRGTSFRAPYEEHCRDDHTYGLCRIHTIGSVSAS
ncbi:ATP-dependent DNA helicase [Microbacterium sp. NPDC076911]|uniref:ATP-dependent helicase n=1 Tax=Microbacterium sp. NPDC076911 TaxID=3154958 RepID=UPI0034432C2E